MNAILAAVLAGLAVFLAAGSSEAMWRAGSPPAGQRGNRHASAGAGPTRAVPRLTTAQQATIARRLRTATSGLDRVLVAGSRPAPIPSAALDALALWRGHAADDVEIWWDSDLRTPFFIRGNDLTLPSPTTPAKRGLDSPTAAALATFARLPEFLGIREPGSELSLLSRETDGLGMTHLRFQQIYRGCRVWARDLYCHFAPDARLTLINGRWAPTPSQLDSVNPVIDATAAVAAVKSHFIDCTEITIGDTALVIYIDSCQTPHWAWMIRAVPGPHEGYDVFIDAVTGSYLHQASFVFSDGPVVGSGVDLFGQTRTVYAYQISSSYYMINTTKPMFDPEASVLPSNGLGVIEIDNYGTLSPTHVSTTNVNSWDNPAAVSAARHLGLVYDYYLYTHNRNSIDGLGASLVAIVNDPIPEDHGNNAYFNPQTQTMTFGTGDGTLFSNIAGALDVTAHELSHGVVEATAALEYEFQSGALNESFADIFGAMAEFYVEGTAADWLIGEDVYTPATPGDALRSMQDPHNGHSPEDPGWQPATMSEYRYLPNTEAGDWGGVHVNSGIPNRAFHLIATSIGRGKADSIYYRTLALYLGSISQFIDLRLAVLQAAADLHPGDTAIAGAIRTAFDQVEIFDGSGTELPDVEPAPTSAQWIAAKYELTGRVARFDTSGVFLGYLSTTVAASKPSVTDSARFVYFVNSDHDATVVDRLGATEARVGDSTVDFANLAVSPDGRKLAYDRHNDPTIYFLDLYDTTGGGDFSWPLYTPTHSESLRVYDVLYADVIEWDIYGQQIIYDCYCGVPSVKDTFFYWDIRTLDTATGAIRRALPSIPSNWTIGNPTYGKIHPNLVAFDYIRSDNHVFVCVADLSKNKIDTVAVNGQSLGRPTFAPDDSRIMFEYDSGLGPNLWRIGFNPATLQTSGTSHVFVTKASYPNWRFEGRDTPAEVNEPDENPSVPSTFSLAQNYPNPFNAATIIPFETRTWQPAELEIFNILGQRVFARVLEDQPPGRHSITWDGRDESGRTVPSGLYLYRLTSDGTHQTRKMVLLK